MRETYLDNAATTPMRPEALSAMLPFLTEHFGNPSGVHSVSRSARRSLDEARESVAHDLGCEPGEVVFTGGGTEADNLAVFGSHDALGGTVVCSAIEHHAVLKPCRRLGAIVVGTDPSGTLRLDELAEVLDPDVRLVSVMLANNEVGTIQPLREVAEIMRERAPEALLHTDAVAAVPWLDVAQLAAVADLVSLSAHKFGGPKGVGALVVRRAAAISPLLHGGEQERARRAGTHNVAGVMGMAAALRVSTAAREAESARVARLRDRLADGILDAVGGATESGPRGEPAGRARGGSRAGKLPSNFHVRFDGVDAEELLVLLDSCGICASAGSACASGALEPSHVLAAMGIPPDEARGALRFSLGTTTTDEDVDYTLEVLPKLVGQLRAS